MALACPGVAVRSSPRTASDYRKADHLLRRHLGGAAGPLCSTELHRHQRHDLRADFLDLPPKRDDGALTFCMALVWLV